jgi:long-chain fatty acid transport protein
MKKHLSIALLSAAVVSFAGEASATNGYFQHGYGVKAKGMGGASIAVVDGALSTANNPAAMVWVGNRVEVGFDYFRPDRSATIGGQAYSANGDESFLLPEFGFNYMLRDDLSIGLALFGNGGLNTTYDAPIYSSFFEGTEFGTNTGVDLAQIFISPTVAYKINDNHSIGVAFNAVLQYFSATGLANFCGFTENGVPAGMQIACPADPAAAVDGLTDQGRDWSHGFSVRIGYQGKLTDWLTVGAYYQSRTHMTRFEKYDNLFAEGGDFDIPEHFGGGIAVTPFKGTLFAFDVQHIRYASVNSVGNLNTGFTAPAAFGLGPALGDEDGPGFAWRDMTVFKFGVEQQISEKFHLRAGYSHGRQPIRDTETAFNVVAPGVIEDHVTVGFSWKLSDRWDIQGFYMHGFEENIRGSSRDNPFSAGFGDLRMEQDSFGFTFGWNF